MRVSAARAQSLLWQDFTGGAPGGKFHRRRKRGQAEPKGFRGADRIDAAEMLIGSGQQLPRPCANCSKVDSGEDYSMGSTSIVRIAAGVLFVIVLVLLIQRRRTRVK